MQDACKFRFILMYLFSMCLPFLHGHAYALPPDVTLLLEQAPDAACDSTIDTPFTSTPLTVLPSNCVVYRLTATNAGLVTAHQVIISDQTPAYTLYQASATCSAPNCKISEPLKGEAGLISGTVDDLLAGQTVSLEFSVILE